MEIQSIRQIISLQTDNGEDPSERSIAQIKLRKTPKQTLTRNKLDIARLKAPSPQKAFNLEVKNRFSVLENTPPADDIQESWNNIKAVHTEIEVNVIGYQTKKTQNGLQLKHDRKDIKQKMLNSKSLWLYEQLKSEYHMKDKEVKRRARKFRHHCV